MKPPGENSWEAWSPDKLAAYLGGAKGHWYIVGGWALDLWQGEQRREHEDLEFATRPEDALEMAECLSGLTFFEAKAGTLRAADPRTQIPEETWQYWGADLEAGRWRVDMMLERGTHSHWIYKRDPTISQPRDLAIRTNPNGIKYLSPANVLLFKAKHLRLKDHDDFESALPKLSDDDRAFLRQWLAYSQPDHEWLQRLI